MVLAAPADGDEKISVFVSIIPQKYFVGKIGGERVEVSVMVGPGASPHIYEPKPQQMRVLSEARIYFAIGVDFERVWLDKIAAMNPDMLIVHTDAGIEKILMKAHHRHNRGQRRIENQPHHKEQRPGHGIKDPHVWLSPLLVITQARNILVALQAIDPANRSVYEANYKRFVNELVELDAELMSIFAEKGNDVEFMVFHPSWGYFAQAYGLKQVPVEIQGKEPKPAELQRLIEYAKERGIRLVFVQPQFSTKSAETIAESIGGEIAFADPLALDWAMNLRRLAAKFKAALR